MKEQMRHPSLKKRFVIAAAVLCAIVLALLAAVVFLAPKAINSGEVRSRIEAVVAKELNGSFTYDRVELSLLPRPDVVLHKVRIDLPGTLSATTAVVRIRAGLFPLFQGRFAVSSIALEQPELSLTLADETAGRNPRKPMQERSGGTFDTALAVASRELPDLSIKIAQGKITLLRERRPVMQFGDMDASFSFVSDKQTGTRNRTGVASYHVTGNTRATLSGLTALPSPLRISVTRFDASPGRLTITNARARLHDLDASVSGDLKGYLTGSPRSDYHARGTIGPESLVWLQSLAGLPESVRLRAPINVTAARLRTSGTGSAATRALTVSARNESGAALALELRQAPGTVSVDSLRVKDSDSDAVMKFSSSTAEKAVSFTGSLSGATIDRIFERSMPTAGWLRGDLEVLLPRGTWEGTSVKGALEGGQLGLPALNGIPITIDNFSVLGDGAAVTLNPATLSFGTEVVHVSGTASLSESSVDLDLDLGSEQINWNTVRSLLEWKPTGADTDSTPKVSGSIHAQAAAFVIDRYRADAVDLRVGFGSGRTTVQLDHASVCGIPLTGTLRIADGDVQLAFAPQAAGQELKESLPCIFRKDMGLSGSYDLTGQIAGHGTWDTLLRSLEGRFALSAAGGRIQSDHVVRGVIAYLNSTSLLKGSHDSLLKEGVPYESITFRGTLANRIISLSEAVIRSRDLHIAAEGNIDLQNGTISLNVLAAPFTKLDRFLGNIPLVKSLVGNALVVVPARVEGTFDQPKVTPMAVSAVGRNVTNLMKNTVQAPMKIIDPAMPEGRDGKKKPAQE